MRKGFLHYPFSGHAKAFCASADSIAQLKALVKNSRQCAKFAFEDGNRAPTKSETHYIRRGGSIYEVCWRALNALIDP
jgi:hypothetical protein